jgi:hypothetical protein
MLLYWSPETGVGEAQATNPIAGYWDRTFGGLLNGMMLPMFSK